MVDGKGTRVAVIGAGSWGTAVAGLVAANAEVSLWARRVDLAETMRTTSENGDYLAGYRLPAAVTPTADLDRALEGAAVVVMGVPSHAYRDVLRRAAGHIGPETAVVSLTKGIERGSLLRMTEVTAEELADHDKTSIGVLSGPNLAKEIAAGQPAATVIAMPDEGRARAIQPLFIGPKFRVYTNPDVVGCESAGALKNVMAIAAGIAHGLGYGDNTLAMLLTRALAELTRLGMALGGKPLTFAGLAGMGDLVATCMSEQSRNHRVGFGLGQGRKLDDVVGEMNMVAEGVKSTAAILELAARHEVEMPIATQVGAVLYDGRPAAEVVPALMTREAKSELHGIG